MSGINNVRGRGADAKAQIVSSRQWRYWKISDEPLTPFTATATLWATLRAVSSSKKA